LFLFTFFISFSFSFRELIPNLFLVFVLVLVHDNATGWLRMAERWSLAGELTLSCARPEADGWLLYW